MAFANWSGERAFEGDKIALDALDGGVRDHSSAVFELGSHIYGFPVYGCFGGAEDIFDRLRDFGADAIAFY